MSERSGPMTPLTPRTAGVLRTACSVAWKELRSSVRDRQTLIYTVVLPLAMYPAIFWIMLQGAAILRGRDELTRVTVGVEGATDALTESALVEGLELVPEEEATEGTADTGEAQGPGLRHPGPLEVEPVGPTDDEAARRELLAPDEGDPALDLLLRFGASADEPTELFYDSTRSRSVLAADRVRERLKQLVDEARRLTLAKTGRDASELRAFDVVVRDLASERDIGGYVFSMILPMLFVFMAVMGAFFPAVDTTAGEKERGTAETTLLLPVPRVGIHLGKVLAVFVAACVAAALNILGMALAAEHLLSSAIGRAFALEIPWGALAAAAPFCGLFLFMVSAILVAVASTTKTFKQGQSLLGSVQMLFFVPAFVSVIPTLKLNVAFAFVPVLQTVLAMRALLQATGPGETAPLFELSLVAVSQLVYTALAIRAAVWVGSHEAARLGAGRLFPKLGRKRKREATT